MKQPGLLQSKHFYLLGYLLLLSTFCGYAQEYQWQWAKSGGGEEGYSGDIYTSFRDECIIDIAIDNDNNYYYLMNLNGNSPIYHDDSLPEDLTLEHYEHKDILLMSTDEDGAYRWHQVIGGNWTDIAHSIAVDSDEGVYLNAFILDTSNEDSGQSPIHLSSEVILPQRPQGWDSNNPHSSFKTAYLLKYSQLDGSLLDYETYQGDVNGYDRMAGINRIWIDSNDIIHTYISLKNGTHLDGLVTVEGMDEISDLKTYLVKFDTSLNIIGTPQEFEMKGTGSKDHFFIYDEELNRYYIGGIKEGIQEFSYNDVEIEGGAFVLAINSETLEEEWRREFDDLRSVRFTSVFVDGESNIYIPGRYNYSTASEQRFFGDYEMPVGIEGGEDFAHVPFTIKLNAEGEVQWVVVPDSFTNQFSPQKQNDNESVTMLNGELITVPRNPASTWGSYSIVSTQDNNTVPAIVRLNPDNGEVLGATYLEGYGAITKVVGDQNGDLVLGGSFFGEMFSDHDEIPTLQAISNKTDFFMAKLHIDTETGTDSFSQANIKVYPNPTTDIVYFETEDPLKYYTVYNQNAQQVKVKTQINETNYQMSFEGMPSGTYFVLMRTESGKNVTAKIEKE